MKKLLTILLAMFLMLGLAACGNGSDEPPVLPENDDHSAEEAPEPEPPQEPAIPETDPMHDPNKVYFHDTYGQFGDNPSVMWGDLDWLGWFDVLTPLTDEGDGWYSFEMPSSVIADNYNMLIFFNGLPDEDPDSIQWIWTVHRGNPNGNYFIADFAKPVNPPDVSFAGEQRDAVSFATLEQAQTGINNVIH
jgi:predicted small lipoprotein YifL